MLGLAFEVSILSSDVVEVTPVLIGLTCACSLFLQVEGGVMLLEACVGGGVVPEIILVASTLLNGDLTEEHFQMLEFFHINRLQGVVLFFLLWRRSIFCNIDIATLIRSSCITNRMHWLDSGVLPQNITEIGSELHLLACYT